MKKPRVVYRPYGCWLCLSSADLPLAFGYSIEGMWADLASKWKMFKQAGYI